MSNLLSSISGGGVDGVLNGPYIYDDGFDVVGSNPNGGMTGDTDFEVTTTSKQTALNITNDAGFFCGFVCPAIPNPSDTVTVWVTIDGNETRRQWTKGSNTGVMRVTTCPMTRTNAKSTLSAVETIMLGLAEPFFTSLKVEIQVSTVPGVGNNNKEFAIFHSRTNIGKETT